MEWKKELNVSPSDQGKRLDQFLCEQFHYLSRKNASLCIDKGWIILNDKQTKKSVKLRIDDCIKINCPIDQDNRPIEKFESYKIIYEDEWLLVVNKPPLLPVHPSGGRFQETLIQLLQQDRDDLSLGLCHRLDAHTSGLVIVGKSKKALQEMGCLLIDREIQKDYIAICNGEIVEEKGHIDAPIGPDIPSKVRVKMAVVQTGEKAKTSWRLLENSFGKSVVLLTPETGKTHQLRVHMAYLGYPIQGDLLYPDESKFISYFDGVCLDKIFFESEISRLALHASQLSFIHPFTGKKRFFEAPLWSDMLRILRKD